jgi:hypothetical protein
MKNYLGDFVIDKLGGHGRYQIILCTIILFIGTFTDFYVFITSFMETKPFVEYTKSSGEKVIQELNYEICEKYKDNLRILFDMSKSTIVTDYEIYCDKFKVSLMAFSILLGALFGPIFLKSISHIGAKKCVIINCALIILSTPFLYIKNFYLLLIVYFIFGVSQLSTFILRNTILTEITGSKYRSYFINVNLCSGIICSLLYYYIFSLNVDWKLLYVANASGLLVVIIILSFYAVENPRYYLHKEDDHSKKRLKIVIEYIYEINKKGYRYQEVEEIICSIDEGQKSENQESIKNDTNFCNSDSDNKNSENTTLKIKDTQVIQVVENCTKNTESLLFDEHTNSNNQKTFRQKYKMIFLTISFFLYVNIIISITIELKKYGNKLDFYYYIFNVLTVFSYYIISLLMNISFIGRKYALSSFLILVIIFKLVKIFLPYFETISETSNFFVILFLTVRLTLYTSQIPFHVLINESFSTKERLANYSTIYFVSKIASLISPFIMEYLSEFIYDLVIMGCCTGISLIILLFVEETLNRKLRD